MHTYVQPHSTGQTGGIVAAAGVFLIGMVFCVSAIGDRADAALSLTLGLLLLAAGVVGLAGVSFLVPAHHPALMWRRALDRGRWAAGGVVIAGAFGSAFDPFLTVILLVAGVLLVGAAARWDRGARQSLLPGVGLLVAGLLASMAVLVLAYHG